ncbi:sialate O-acetylesterase [Danxiaibacter flavus]|uniref:Sialate O-acetylesterase n=1 Tax=Danxiaibacter flavus TaxID=3049108 RepID=A0ABV3ZEF1_9BACT|nr:sialate O-acetylesterase [Chitinophagaceae bacterium DXS]
MKFVLAIFFLSPFALNAQLQVAKIFSDNMVLQRDKPVSVWGKAIPGNSVAIHFAHQQKVALTLPDSSWHIVFPAQHVNTNPQSISITCGNQKIVLKNILVGDVWLCLGQSNMEFPMKNEAHYSEALQSASQPLIRFYNPTYIGKNVFGSVYPDSMLKRLNAKEFYNGSWQVSDTSSIKNMSAVAWYFGKMIKDSVSVPIGLINLSIGGCPIETFTDVATLAGNPAFKEKVKGNWLQNKFLPEWVKERGIQNLGGNSLQKNDGYGPDHAYKPGFAYKAGVQPILQMPIKGVLWYQGESNAQEIGTVKEYGQLFKLLVSDYRIKWQDANLPFYWVQLSSIDSTNYQSQLWPVFRDEQRKMLSEIVHSGMAVCSDIGAKNDVHPTNKKNVGERLARWALYNDYKKNIMPSGPLPQKAIFKDGKVIITFQYASGGLNTSNNVVLRGFSFDGIKEVNAAIDHDKVAINSINKPAYVYYGWKSFTDANLVNSALLPASTFKIKVQ